MPDSMELTFVGAIWNKTLARFRDEWLRSGAPVALLDGFPGTGKTLLAKELGSDPKWIPVHVETSKTKGSEQTDLVYEIASELEVRGIDDLIVEIGRGESADWIRALKRVLVQRKILIIIDDAQRGFEPGSTRPFGALRSLIQKLGDTPAVSGKLLLVSNRKIEAERWSEKCERATLAALSDAEAVSLLSRLLSEANITGAVPPNRLCDAALHMGCNPRALHTLVTALMVNGYTIDDLVKAFPDAWTPAILTTRIDDPDLVANLERDLLEGTLLRVEPELLKLLCWLSVHRREFGREALSSVGTNHEDGKALRLRLIECFLLESHRGFDKVNSIAREICEYRLHKRKEEWRKAHGVAADYHLRHFEARQLTGGKALAPSFAELRYHLYHAGRLHELDNAARRFTYHLRSSFGTATAIPTDNEALNERIALLSMLLAEPGNKPVEYHLAGCLEKRRMPGDLENGLVHARRATGANAFYPAWLLRLNLESEIHGPERVSPVILEATRHMSTDSQLFALYQRGSDIFAKAGREQEAIALLKQGISVIPPDKSLNALYQACGQLQARNGKANDAIALLQEGLLKVPKDKGSISLYQALADLLEKSGRTAEALGVLQSGIDNLSPARNLAPLYQASADLFQKTGNIDDAIAILRQGMAIVPPEQNLRALYQACADLLIRKGRKEEARRTLRIGLGAIPVGKLGRYILSEAALRLAADQASASEIEEMLRARGKLEIEPQQQILGRCLLHQLRGERQMMQREAEAGLKLFPKFEALKPFASAPASEPKERANFGKILAIDEAATRELDTQALEQILIGHMLAIAGEANQIFRPVTMFDHGIDGEVEFKDNDGKASGKRIYIQLKSGNSYLRTRKGDGNEVFDVSNDRHLEYWISQPVDVYLVIRQTDELSGQQVIRWMNVTRYLKARKDKKSRQIIFAGEKLDMEAVWTVRDGFFPAVKARK